MSDRSAGLGVSIRRGVDVDGAITRLRQIDEGFTATPTPSVIYNLQQIGATPWYLAAFLVVLGLSGLTHALATGRRLGRKDIAVTRALGLSPGQSTVALCGRRSSSRRWVQQPAFCWGWSPAA